MDIINVPTTLFLLYPVFSFLALGLHDNKVDDMKRYHKAVSEYNIIMETKEIDYDLFQDYIMDITQVNKLIDDSKKYHNNWYLGPFYYKEIGELKPINIDSVNIKLTF